ncbi:hypothetical protein BDQ17DRAFT_1224182, partial [Cyathus striatus]
VPITGGVIFGLIHCISWNSHFPSLIERNLWRTSAVIVSSALIFLSCDYVFLLYWRLNSYKGVHFTSHSVYNFCFHLIIIFATLYALARFYLLVKAVIAFRALPASALENVNWYDFIPHI